MIEAVGEAYWPTYFRALDELLAPGGRVGLQSITMAHDRMLATRRGYTWIHKYVFPGGIVPSVRHLESLPSTRVAISSAATSARTTRTRWSVGGKVPRQLGASWRAPSMTLPADVGVLPRVLRGRVRAGYLGVSQFGLARSPFGAGFGSPRGSLLSPRAGH